jgi:hypothetical protein
MRKWIALSVASTLMIMGLLGFGIWHRARFEVAVQPRHAPSLTKCVLIVSRHVAPSAVARAACQRATQLPWFHISVRNDGHSPAYAYCWAHGYDALGETVSRFAIPIDAFANGLPRLAPGESLQADWFFPEPPSRPVSRYAAGCSRASRPGPL